LYHKVVPLWLLIEMWVALKGKWYCPSCVLLPKFNKSIGKYIEGHIFTHAQHTVSILSTVDVLSLSSLINAIGKVPCEMVYFCFDTNHLFNMNLH